jgi:hypothetical protein
MLFQKIFFTSVKKFSSARVFSFACKCIRGTSMFSASQRRIEDTMGNFVKYKLGI